MNDGRKENEYDGAALWNMIMTGLVEETGTNNMKASIISEKE